MSTSPLISRALSDPTRLKILELLGECNYCVNALAMRLEITQPAVSQHLRILKQANLVIPKKKGYWIHYTINIETVNEYLKELKNLFQPKGGKETCVKKRRCVNIRKS